MLDFLLTISFADSSEQIGRTQPRVICKSYEAGRASFIFRACMCVYFIEQSALACDVSAPRVAVASKRASLRMQLRGGRPFCPLPPAAFRGCRSLLLGIKPTFWIVIFSRGRFSRPVCNPALFPFNLRCQARNAWRAIYRCAVVVGFFPWFALELHPLVTSRTIVTSQLRLLIVDFPRQTRGDRSGSHFFRLRSCSEIFESGNFFNLRIRLLFRLRLQSSIQPKFTPALT